jgi:hypothetical protein
MISSFGMLFTLFVFFVHSSTEYLEGQTGVLVARRWRVSSLRME